MEVMVTTGLWELQVVQSSSQITTINKPTSILKGKYKKIPRENMQKLVESDDGAL